MSTLVLLELGLQVAALFVSGAAIPPGSGSAGDVRVVAIGESTTHGFGQTPYPTLLQKLLDERLPGTSFEVINAGLPGTHAPYLSSQIEDVLAEHRPDLVIAMMGINDEVYFTDTEQVDELPTWQILLLRSRVYKLFRLLWTNADRQIEEEVAPELREEVEDVAHLRAYRRRYGEAKAIWVKDPARAVAEFDDVIAMARAVGRERDDGTLQISGPYWHIYEISQRRASEWYVENGDSDEAVRRLRETISLHPESARFRRRLIWILESEGDVEAAAEEKESLAALGRSARLRVTAASWRQLLRALRAADVRLVALQYPLRDVEVLRTMLDGADDVIFVENVENFQRALSDHEWNDVFIDRFAGDFGHSTKLGNTLIAENLMDEVFVPLYGASSMMGNTGE